MQTFKHRASTARMTTIAVSVMLIGASALTFTPKDVFAQQIAASATRVYGIGAGPLGDVLAEFAAASEVRLVFDPVALQGKTSQGLRGQHSVPDGFAQLLKNSGHRAVTKGNREFGLELIPTTSGQGAVLPEVTVTASTVDATSEGTNSYAAKGVSIFKGAKSLKEIPQSISVMTRQQMDEQSLDTLEEAVSRMPGVSVSTYGGGPGNGGQVWVRGQQMSTYQFDGVSSSLAGYTGDTAGGHSDMAIYDRIELLRGPAGLLNGVGQAAGAVNLVRKRPGHQFGGAFSASAGSWSNYHGTLDVTGPLNEQGTLRGRFVMAAQDRDFFYAPSTNQNWTAYGALDYDLNSATTLGLAFIRNQNRGNNWWTGQPTYSNGQFLNVDRSKRLGMDWNDQDNKNNDFVADLTHQLNHAWSFRAVTRYATRDNNYLETYTSSAVDPLNNTASWMARQGYGDDKSFGYDINLSGSYTLFDRSHDLVIGYSGERSEYDRYQRSQSLGAVDVFSPAFSESAVTAQLNALSYGRNRYKENQSGWYGMTRFSLSDPLKVIIGARMSDYEAFNWSLANGWVKGANTASNHISPYGGLVYELTPEVSLYGSYTDIFRPTSNYGKNGVLDPIIGWQVEAGAKGSFFDGNLNASFAVFQLNETNRPIVDTANVGCGPSVTTCFISAGLARTRGFEAEVSGSPMPHLQISASYTNSDTVYIRDGNPANVGQRVNTQKPKHQLALWGRYKFTEGMFDRFTVGGGLRWQSATWWGTPAELAAGTQTRRQAAYGLVDAQIGYQIDSSTDVTLNIRNLFDKSYYSRVSYTSFYTIYGEPRSAMLTLRKKF